MNFNDSDDDKEEKDISHKLLLLESPRKLKIEQKCGYDIIHYAATVGINKKWNNPMENKIINATATSASPSTNPISCIFDPSKKAYRTFNKPDQSIEIILPFSVIITSYQLIQKELKSKKWLFQGWFQNNWSVIINNHPKNDDDGITNDGRIWSVPKKKFTGTAFRRFRIKQTGRNNNHGHTLEVQQIKMYGLIFFDEFISSIHQNEWDARKKLSKQIEKARSDVEIYCVQKRVNLSKNSVVGIQINGDNDDVYKGTIKNIIKSIDQKASNDKLVIRFAVFKYDKQEDEFYRNSKRIKILNPDYDVPEYGLIDINQIISDQFSDDNDNNNTQQQSKPAPKPLFTKKNMNRFVQYGWDEQLTSTHLTISADGNTVINTASNPLWQCAISKAIFNTAQYSFEVEILNTTTTTNQWQTVVGVVPVNFNVDNDAWIGAQNSWGYIGATGGKCCDIKPFERAVSHNYGAAYDRKDTIKCELNFSDGTIKFYRNKQNQGIAFKNLCGAVHPAVCISGKGAAVRIKNVGQ